jgi:hypothetical protein
MSQQSFYYVTTKHKQSVRTLYKLIFQLHKSLPLELKEIGNSYVRSEFKLHKAATPELTKTFLHEWMVSFIWFFHLSTHPFLSFSSTSPYPA